MDYEVSLLSRVREAYLPTGRPSQAITEGLVQTARVIAAAAPIMVSAFALSDDVLLKLIGVGLAAAILVDAEVVRMLLVPAVMHLLGDRGRWLPRWLDCILPEAELEAAPHDQPRRRARAAARHRQAVRSNGRRAAAARRRTAAARCEAALGARTAPRG